MKKRIVAVLLSFILILPFTACGVKDLKGLYGLKILRDAPAARSDATPLCWKATGKDGGTVYLFGSIHAADSSYWRLSDEIMQGFLDSDALAVEIDIIALEKNYALQFEMLSMSMYRDGTNLDSHIGKPLADAFLTYLSGYPEYLEALGIPVEQLDKLRTFTPAYLTGIVDSMVTAEAGLFGDWGVDSIFTKLAKELKKEIIELETAEFQLNLLYNVSDELARVLIKEAISDTVRNQAVYTRYLYESWKVGDLEFFDSIADFESDFTDSGFTQAEIDAYLAFEKAMNADRNILMAEKAKAFIDGGKNVFYVVGEMHMTGKTGIVSALKNQGYSVELISGGTPDTQQGPGGSIAA